MSKKRIKELEANLRMWKEAYYNDQPLVSDSEYDEAEDELRDLDPDNDVFSIVGAEATSDNKRKHKIHMGSQAKVKIEEGGIDYIIENFLNKGDTIVSYKMDGISFADEYKKGKHQHATTRGDGEVGDDIPDPTAIGGINDLETDTTSTFRGEIVLPYADFELINAELPDEDKFSNPRNAVAGIARKEESPYRSNLVAYYYNMDVDNDITDKVHVFGALGEALADDDGIPNFDNVVPYFVNMTPDEFRTLAEDLDKNRKNLPYMIDGLVIEFDDLEYYNSLGIGSGNKPKGSIALKFNPVAEETTVTDVVWQVGSTGNLTPVVEFEPTLIDGSIVRRASIHNYDIFKEWNFGKGDIIRVQKNNDIIPQVKSVVKYSDEPRFTVPAHCPICDCETHHEKISKTTNLVCFNAGCPAKFMGSVKKWATKAGMTTKGVGDAFFKDYCVSNDTVAGLYDLTVQDIMDLSDRYKEKSATNIYNAIQSSRSIKLMDFFGGLNILGAGSRTFKKIIEHSKITDVDMMCEFLMDSDLHNIDGIGEKTAEIIKEGIKDYEYRIDCLSTEVAIEAEEVISADAQTFLFTGTFVTIDPDTGKGYKRKALEALVSSKGHKPASSVNKKLNYLVTSDPESTSGKMKKARDAGVTILGEDEFFNIMENK